MVKIQINNATAQLSDIHDLTLIDKLSKLLSYERNSSSYQKYLMQQQRWDGTYRLLTKRLSFPSGCVSRVEEFLTSQNVSFECIDKRDYDNGIKENLQWNGFSLYPYQEKLVAACLERRGGIVRSCTGSGKSACIAKLTAELNVPTVIYVVSIDLVEQMKETLEASLKVPIGVVGGGECDIQRITVCSAWTPGKLFSKKKAENIDPEVKPDTWTPSQQQAHDIKQMVQNARLVILDEAQFAAADTIRVILANSTSAAYRYGFSGTPWRMDGDDLLLEAAFGPIIFNLPASDLIRQGYLVPPRILFKDMPPIVYDAEVDESYTNIKKHYLVQNKHRNTQIMRGVTDLLQMGRKPLVLFKEHAHGNALEELIPPDVRYHMVTGKLKRKERTQIRQDFMAGKIDLILASTVYDQGVDLPPLDALVLANSGKSTAKALQRVGRVIRGYKGKKDAWVLDSFDQAPYLRKHSYLRYRIFNTEPEFRIRVDPAFTSYINRIESHANYKASGPPNEDMFDGV